MFASNSIGRVSGRRDTWFQIKVWHLALLVVIVAIATRDIQTHARNEPALQLLAAAGYAGYFFLAWLIWLRVRRFEAAPRLARFAGRFHDCDGRNILHRYRGLSGDRVRLPGRTSNLRLQTALPPIVTPIIKMAVVLLQELVGGVLTSDVRRPAKTARVRLPAVPRQRHADRSEHEGGSARGPQRAAGGRRQFQRRPGVHGRGSPTRPSAPS